MRRVDRSMLDEPPVLPVLYREVESISSSLAGPEDLERIGDARYVPTVLPHRYDAFVFLDTTHALHPLGVPARPEAEPPETYPSGI